MSPQIPFLNTWFQLKQVEQTNWIQFRLLLSACLIESEATHPQHMLSSRNSLYIFFFTPTPERTNLIKLKFLELSVSGKTRLERKTH